MCRMLSEEEFRSVRGFWLNYRGHGTLFTELKNHIVRKLGLYQKQKPYRCGYCLLYGDCEDAVKILHEEFIGTLVAFVPGIVLLHAADPYTKYTGFLERHKPQPQSPALFSIRLLTQDYAQKIFGPSLRLYPSSVPWDHGFSRCPVFISIDDGVRGHAESPPDYFGIDPARWLVMEQWLNKWLPTQND